MNERESIEHNELHWKLFVLILKKTAEQKGISQQEISEKSGMLRTNVNRVFNMKYCPKINTFLALCQAVGVNFFFEDKEGDSDLNVIFKEALKDLKGSLD